MKAPVDTPLSVASGVTRPADLHRKRVLAGHAALASGAYWVALAGFVALARGLEMSAIGVLPVAVFVSLAAVVVAANFVYVRGGFIERGPLGYKGVTAASTMLHTGLSLAVAIVDQFGAVSAFILLVGTPVVLVFYGLNFGFRATLLFGLGMLFAFSAAYLLITPQPHTLEPELFTIIIAMTFCLDILSAVVNGMARHRKYTIVNLLRDQQERNQLIDEQNRRLEQQSVALRRMSMVDGLTGVANRRHFDEVFAREWQRTQRDPARRTLALVLADIDHFKAYNDTHGHIAGDACLTTVARAIEQAAQRPADLAARYGGEEFVILLPDTDLEGARMVSSRVREMIAELAIDHGPEDAGGLLTVSQGVAVFDPAVDDTPRALLARCDRALFRAKDGGRDRIVVAATHA